MALDFLAQATTAAPPAQAMADQLAVAEAVIFFVLAAVVVVSAWACVVSQNIVRMAVYLLLTLGGVAGFYFMLAAEFLAAIQLIVYAGGTLILIIFGVMLTSKNPFMQLRAALWERMVGPMLGLFIAGLLVWALATSALPSAIYGGPTAREASPRGHAQVADIGRALLGEYVVPFEVAGVLLLVVMIGAAFMARKRVR